MWGPERRREQLGRRVAAAVQRSCIPDRKHVPHSRGLRKADLMVKDFQLAGIRDLIIDVSMRHEFHGSCQNHMRNGEASHADANGALDAAVKAKLDNYLHDYNERNLFFLPAAMTKSGRIRGDFLRLLYILSDRQADNYFARMGLLDPSTKAFKQRRGSYFYYNRAAIGNIRLIVYRKYSQP